MPHDPIRLSFKIDAYEPETIPLARLAEYMTELAAMIGERASVHFIQLEQGCVQLVHEVEYEAFPKVEARAHGVSIGDAPAEALNAYKALNKLLAGDNTFARYEVQGLDPILEFPGITAPKPVEIAPVEQPGAIDGQVVGVGGRGYGNNVPIYVDTGAEVHHCTASRAIAKELGHFILEDERRFHGKAVWARDEDGAWTLKRFDIQSHDALDMSPLSSIVDQMRAVPSGLTQIPDPWGQIMRDRRDEGEPN